MTDEFPAELVERCAKAMRQDAIARTTNNRGIFDPDVPPSEGELSNTRAALRASGHAELVAALAFYADPETYVAIGFLPDHPCGAFIDDFDETEEWSFRPGKRARAALAAVGQKGMGNDPRTGQ